MLVDLRVEFQLLACPGDRLVPPLFARFFLDEVTRGDLLHPLVQSARDRKGRFSFLEEIYQALKRGESVTLGDFGSFYVRPEQGSWVFRFNPSQRWRKLFG